MKTMYLDCGNSRLKWRMGNDAGSVNYDDVPQWSTEPPFYSQDIAQLRATDRVDRVVFAAVRYDKSLEEAVQRWRGLDIEVVRIETAARAAGVTCAYPDPSKLGIDRWLAVIAAWHARPSNLVIVDAGTAITVDCVAANGRHLGGYIVPGLRLMLASLAAQTERVKVSLSEREASLAPASETDAAVNRGVLLMVVGLVTQALALLLADDPDGLATILVCGGDGPKLLPHIKTEISACSPAVEVRHVQDLVLDGLEIVHAQV